MRKAPASPAMAILTTGGPPRRHGRARPDGAPRSSFVPQPGGSGRQARRAPTGGHVTDTPGRQPCAGGIVFDDRGRLLLVQRGRPPAIGSWTVPGGRCLPGEEPAAACVREVAEETGLAVQVLSFAGRVERDAPDGGVYVIDDFTCTV